MSDAVWYYAQNDQEKGPVTPAELKSLAAAGKLQRTDLVWKEGMDDWTPAAEIRGLLPAEPPSAQPGSAPGREKPAGISDSRWVDGPPADDPVSGVPRVPMGAGGRSATSNDTARPRVPGQLMANVLKYCRMAGIAMLGIGLFIVLGAKGCDTLNNRYVVRVTAMAKIAENQFQQAWDQERKALEAEITQLEAQNAIAATVDAKKTQLASLNAEKAIERQQLEAGDWAAARAAARDAPDYNRAWAFWRSLTFVFGSGVLVLGLLVVGFTGQGHERWICLAMLAVVTFSLFGGSFAWQGLLLEGQ